MNLFTDTGVRLAKAGYAVFGIDYKGHGKSTGTRCYIQSFDDLVIDCATFFRVISGMYWNVFIFWKI
jgi:acylglycerol lipase